MRTIMAIAISTLLVSCGGGGGSGGTSSGNSGTAARSAVTLHNFVNAPDGLLPMGALIQASDGNFYGTTSAGGTYGSGTIYRMTPTGSETVLYSFGSGSDGSTPQGPLLQGADGNFYGVTISGGSYDDGTFFRVTPSGTETVLHSFGASGDGAAPNPGPIAQDSAGNFYGTTFRGGAYIGTGNGQGTVFKITLAGVESVLWSFGGTDDGADPSGGIMLAPDGYLYGTTTVGGAHYLGTVFKLATDGSAESVLWSFAGDADGNAPSTVPVVGTDGNFYGVTSFGGNYQGGVFYRLTPAGTETVLYSFGEFAGDSDNGIGQLVPGPGGIFYASAGGGINNSGTLFTITQTGAETVLYSFAPANAFQQPNQIVLGSDGSWYGSLYNAGSNSRGLVFKY